MRSTTAQGIAYQGSPSLRPCRFGVDSRRPGQEIGGLGFRVPETAGTLQGVIWVFKVWVYRQPSRTIYVGPTCGTWALQRIDEGGLGKMQDLEFRVERN